VRIVRLCAGRVVPKWLTPKRLSSVMACGAVVCDGPSDGTGRQEGCGLADAVDAVGGYSTDRRMVSMRW
jgi:hypothetical protein